MKLSEFVETNPKIKLDKGEEYEFVEMADVTPGKRHVYSQRKRKLKGGGSKFQSGDVLFARITPCLEHGKIAQFKSNSEKPAFGSTEFFVFRKKEGVSNQDYVFYLSLTDTIRKPAEKSMVGASGRQRAKLETVRNIEFNAPELPEQQKIASILSKYDDLIENNTKRIQLLEKIAKLIYDEWFVKFRFPGHEKVKMVNSELGEIPEGWVVMKLQDCIELAYGKGLKQSDRKEGNFLVYGSSGVVGKHNEFLVEGPGIIVGRKGNVGSVFWTFHDFYPIDTVYYVKSEILLYYVYYNFLNQHFLNNDAAVPGLSRKQAYLLPFLKPDDITLALFEKQIEPTFKEIERLNRKNSILAKTRDLLLPKLISGQVDVSDLDIKVPEMQEVVV
jgi:type I restriction enzyme S subunit